MSCDCGTSLAKEAASHIKTDMTDLPVGVWGYGGDFGGYFMLSIRAAFVRYGNPQVL